MQRETSGTILWLTGWSMPDTVFERLRELLPDFYHVSVDYSAADTPEKLMYLTEKAALNLQSSEVAACMTRVNCGPLLIGGWSLGGLLALKLAVKGYADGLVLFAATARFTRSKEETDRGWADAYVRQMITGLTKDRQTVETKFRQLMFTEAEWEAGLGQSLSPIGSWTTPALITGLQILRSEECKSQLSEINCPVLLVHGTEDKICPYGAAEELVAYLPQAELLTIPVSGHAPFLGREVHIAEVLRRWWHEQ
ncbi:alpha/beta fold hydrolase [Paenibacillus sp. S3N08]|uniref:Alpha/beta fold hydrolase n=1 Tax=Paenibacillus agricola TaxID=2716264 RepID=A0ABX0J5V9_9BACL|nr:alpha/beta fold hydrolase [Paenibacillus agricola]